MAVPITDLSSQHRELMPELRSAFEEVVSSGRLILGRYVEQFEGELAAACGVAEAVGVSSGTDAITLALLALDLPAGSGVVCPAFAYVHTAESIVRAGHVPVFADINPRTFNLDARSVEAAVTDDTSAILAPNLFGLPAPFGPLSEIASHRGLKLIEDADTSLGASLHGRPSGSLGDVATVSFFPTKTLAACGDAGACLTDDPDLAERMRVLRVHGLDSGYTVSQSGGAFRMDPLQAAFLSVKLPYLTDYINQRRQIAARYQKMLEPLAVTTPDSAEDVRHAYGLYTLRVRGGGREPLRHHLNAIGISNRVYYPRPLHLQPVYAHLGYEPGMLPNAEKAASEVLSIPMFPEMTVEQQDEVVAGIRDYFMAD